MKYPSDVKLLVLVADARKLLLRLGDRYAVLHGESDKFLAAYCAASRW
jgi:hypothetical protein